MVQAVRESTAQRGFPRDDEADRAAVATITGLQASTLHRLLGWTPNGTRFRHHRGNRLPYDVVVVDETSMLSLTMMARLVEAVRPSARLVLVGDADQLASVDAGAVLKDLVDGYGRAAGSAGSAGSAGADRPTAGASARHESPVAQLSHTRRFGERIGALALAIRDGDVDAVMAELHAGSREVLWLRPAEPAGSDVGEPRELLRLLASRAATLREAAASGDPARALVELERHRLLCAHREGPFGVAHWNRTVEGLLMEATGQEWLPDWYAGRPFVVNTNDYGLRLWNGDTGVVCRDGADLVAVIGDGERLEGRALPTSRLAEVSTAHAMTVHRSQGSQFDEVTVAAARGGVADPHPRAALHRRDPGQAARARRRDRGRRTRRGHPACPARHRAGPSPPGLTPCRRGRAVPSGAQDLLHGLALGQLVHQLVEVADLLHQRVLHLLDADPAHDTGDERGVRVEVVRRRRSPRRSSPRAGAAPAQPRRSR